MRDNRPNGMFSAQGALIIYAVIAPFWIVYKILSFFLAKKKDKKNKVETADVKNSESVKTESAL